LEIHVDFNYEHLDRVVRIEQLLKIKQKIDKKLNLRKAKIIN